MTHAERQGYWLSASASVLFTALPLYVGFFAVAHGLTLLLHRAIWQFVLGIALVLATARGPRLLELVRDRRRLAAHLLTSALIALQWWLFVWAPTTGRVLEVAVGYLVLPITLVGAGVLFHREPLSRFSRLAVGLALVGLALELALSGRISWVSAIVFLGYPPYFMLHRRIGTESALVTLALESGVVCATCLLATLAFAPTRALPGDLAEGIRLAGLGALAFAGMACYIGAGVRLPFNVFGLLGYLEPVLLTAVALAFLRETAPPQKLAAYGCFAAAVLAVAYEGLRDLRSGSGTRGSPSRRRDRGRCPS